MQCSLVLPGAGDLCRSRQMVSGKEVCGLGMGEGVACWRVCGFRLCGLWFVVWGLGFEVKINNDENAFFLSTVDSLQIASALLC